MRNFSIFTLTFVLALAGCASSPKSDEAEAQNTPSATERAIERTNSGVGDAATAPLEDLNLKRAEIPDLLKTIDNPYRVELELSCEDIAEQVEALNAILGRDWDVPPPDKKSIDEQAADGASTAFLDAVASGASGLIPYRGIVRTVTGANAHKRKVLKAYDRGAHRRTFLKAIGKAKGCPAPAAPDPLPDEDNKIVFK